MRATWLLAAAALAGLWACSEGTDAPDGFGVAVAGRVVSDSDSAIADAEVRAIVHDTSMTIGREVTVRADSLGRFTAWVPLDTLLAVGQLRLLARAALGSGLRIAEAVTPLTFLEGGRANPPEMALTVVRTGPPVPAARPAPLAASALVGRRYRGWTIDPQGWTAALIYAMSLDLHFGVSADSIHGRYEVDYEATRVCGNGLGTFTGVILADTLFMRLASDTFPGWTPPRIITDFKLVTHDGNADTLVATEVVAPADCGVGEAVPLRLLRR